MEKKKDIDKSKNTKIEENSKETKESNKLKTVQQEDKEKIEEPEIFDNLPPEIKKVVEMGMSVQRFSGSLPNPILSKLDKEHITKILEQGEKEEENLYKDKQSTKKYNLIYFILILLLIVFLVIYLANENKDLLLEIIKYVVIVAGSFGGGYGYKAYKDRSSD